MGLLSTIVAGFKALGFAKKNVEKKYSIYKTFRNLNISANESDFDSIYNQSLYDFEYTKNKLSEIIQLFRLGSAKAAFRSEYYQKTENSFYDDLNVNLQTKEEFQAIKDHINLPNEISEFLELFNAKVEKSRSPKEVAAGDSMAEIGADLKTVLMTIKTGHLPEQLKDISNLRKNHNYKAALEMLSKFKEKKWDELTPDLKYSVTLNIAVTHIENGEKKVGADYLIRLPEFNVNKEEALGYASLGHALLGNTEKSIEFAHEATKLNPENINALLGLFFSKEDTLDIDEVDQLIPLHLQSKPELAINIATFLEKKHEYEKAFVIFEKLNEDHPEMDSFKCDILVQLGNNRMHSIPHKDDYLFRQLNEESIARVSYASEKFEQAWNYLKGTELAKSKWYVLTNKGVANKVLGRMKEAERDFLDSLALHKNYFTYRHLLILKLDAGENVDELLNEIEQLSLTDEEKREIGVFKSDLLFSAGKNEEAIELLLMNLPGFESPDLRKQYLSMIVETYLRINNLDEAEKYALLIAEEFPENPLGFLNLFKVMTAKNEPSIANEYLLKARNLITEATPHYIADLIGDRFNSLGQFKEAADIFETIADTNLLSSLTKKLITAYFQSGNHKKVIEISNHLLSIYSDEPFLVDIISAVYETTDKFDDAIRILSDYLEKKPDDRFMIVKLSMNLYKKGEYAEGGKQLDKITDFSNIPLHVQFLIAHAYILNKQIDKGFSLAYSLRGKHYSDPTVHSRYIQCITGKDDLGTDVYFPPKVGPDCYVVLSDKSGKTFEFILVAAPEFPNEVSLTEPLAVAILGKSIGDEVKNQTEDLTIKSILWKYTYALHDSMDQLSVRFGNTQPIKVFKLREGDNPLEQFGDIFQNIDRAHEFDKEAEKLYLEGKTTIGVNATLSSVSPIKYWGRLVNTWDTGIISIGRQFEHQIGIQLLNTDKPMVFDIIGLLTLFNTDGFPLLSHREGRKVVAKSTLEIIQHEIESLKNNLKTETLIVNKIGNQYYRFIQTVEEKEKQLASLERFEKLVLDNCEILSPELSEDFESKQKKDKVLGLSFNDSILIAKDIHGLLYSDDVFLRSLGFNEDRVNGVSTFIFLVWLKLNQKISEETLVENLEKLIKLNYRNIPSSPQLLYKIYTDCHQSIEQPFINACDFINPLFLADVKAARFVVDFLYEVYTTSIITSGKTFVTQFILSRLFAGRNVRVVKNYLVALLDTKFFLLTPQKKEIMNTLRSFSDL